MIEITLNGKSKHLNNGVSIKGLLSGLDLPGRRVAVEINGEVIPASLHNDTLIKTDDHIEVVTAIGGG